VSGGRTGGLAGTIEHEGGTIALGTCGITWTTIAVCDCARDTLSCCLIVEETRASSDTGVGGGEIGSGRVDIVETGATGALIGETTTASVAGEMAWETIRTREVVALSTLQTVIRASSRA
jgi:hypothetical protein